MSRRLLVLVATIVLATAACVDKPAASGCCATAPNASSVPMIMELKVGLGYIPSVQFAPFYYAQQQGYYADAGLSVSFENKIDPDLVTLVGQGALDLGVSDGTSVIPAASQGIPVKYVATIYGTFPSIVFAKESSGIRTAADLKGRKIGIPGKYGSSWIMLQALLDSAGLKPSDANIVEYPDFGQGAAVQAGAVDAATGFTNNEPVQLELSGSKAVVLHVDQVVALPGPGLIVGTSTLAAKADAVSAFVNATLRAMTEIAADPQLGLDAAIKAVPELGKDEAAKATQKAILAATIATWSPADGGGTFGTIDEQGWKDSIAYMTKLKLVPNPVTVDQLVQKDVMAQG
ncbi:MAG TPA: ABC transporter substrate-binding protein [Candidatus Limnocylindrales bacterium]|nr:ABC transporter substrate-binding protein [Candidatus Limnocylindrales bacterium]